MTLSKVSHLIFVFIFACAAAVSAQKQPAKKVNILWISAEDLSPWLGCYGDNTVPTPNIDRLAAEGVRYTHAFTAAGVCAPSRCAIITSMYQTTVGGHNMRTMGISAERKDLPRRYSIVPPPYVKAFPEYLRAAGYYCTNNVKTDYQFEAPPTVWDEVSNTATYANRAAGQPFFAIFNSTITHESQVWARAKNPLRVDPAKVKVPPFYPDTDSIRGDIARFYSNISELDDWVGERLRDLEAAGELDNTIIFFWGDHGNGLPYFKREITDRGLRVPLIIRYPGKKHAGTVVDDLVSFIDLGPTVLSLAGIKPPAYMQGQALAGSYKAKKSREYIFGARDRVDVPVDRVRSVRDRNLRYIRNFNPSFPIYQHITYRMQQPGMREIIRLRDAGQLNELQMRWFKAPKAAEELYDLNKDPWELTNVADDPTYRKDLERLRGVMDKWIEDTNDLGRIPEPELISRMWGGQDEPPVTADPDIAIKNGVAKITSATEGASIGYKIITPGGDEQSSWMVYTTPLKVPPGSKLVAVAQRIGYQPSKDVAVEAGR